MQMTVTRFKATCLGVIESVAKEKNRVIITRHGKPAAEVIPFIDVAGPPLFGRASGSTQIVGDIISPIGETWSADV